MQNKFKILVFAGSLRKGSFNKKLAKWASSELKQKGFSVTYIDIADYPLPVYNQDIEKIPQEAIQLEKLMEEHQVWLISSPEYNYSIPGNLKNLIDFVSRSPENQPNLKVFSNKIIGLISASGSNLGGIRCLNALREMFTTLGCLVIPTQANIGNSFAAFDEQDRLKHETDKKAVLNVLTKLTDIATKCIR